jgi:hypothetical protein
MRGEEGYVRFRRWIALFSFLVLTIAPGHSATLEQTNGTLRLEVHGTGPEAEEIILVKVDGAWKPALSATSSPLRIRTQTGSKTCALRRMSPIDHGLLLAGDCEVGEFEQRIVLSAAEEDVLDISTRLTLHHGTTVTSVEDRYDFMPERHSVVNAEQGPLDFAWSQNIKSEPDDLIPTYTFKSPAVMLQQGAIFVALMPDLSSRLVEPLALDLDVTSEKRPWISFGQIPAQPHGHSYFRRAPDGHPKVLADTVQYSYSILASQQSARFGYRRVVRRLWARFGHDALLNSPELQQNVIRHELRSLASWRNEAWNIDANRIYIPFDCDGQRCGTLLPKRMARFQPSIWWIAISGSPMTAGPAIRTTTTPSVCPGPPIGCFDGQKILLHSVRRKCCALPRPTESFCWSISSRAA